MTNKIILAMIAGNEAAVLPRCIESFAGAIDGLVICWARGCTEPDDSESLVRAVCSNHGIPVAFATYKNADVAKDWPHIDNFAAARNVAYQGALNFGQFTAGAIEPGWLLWADADDILAPGSAPIIREFAERDEASVLFFPYILGADGGQTRRERMGRAEVFFSWTGAVHERIIWRPDAVEAYVPEVAYLHAPLVSKTGGGERNIRILEAIPEENRTGRDFFYLYTEYSSKRRIAEAMQMALVAVDRTDVHLEEKFSIYLTMGQWIKDLEGAERPILEAMRLMPGRREPYAEMAKLHLSRPEGSPAHALAYVNAMRGIPIPSPIPMWHNPGLYAWEAWDLHDIATSCNGRPEEAAARRRARFRENGRRITIIHTTQNAAQAVFLRNEWLQRAANPFAVEWIFGLSPSDPDVIERLRHYPHAIAEGPGRAAARSAGVYEASGKIFVFVEDDIHPPQAWDEQVWQALRDDLKSDRCLVTAEPTLRITTRSGWLGEKEISAPHIGFARRGQIPWKEQIDTRGISISVAHPTCRPEQAIRIKEMWLARATRPDRIEYIFGTEPGLAPRLAEHDHRVSEPVPEGYSSAVVNYNAAALATTGQIIIAAQDDIEPPQGWDESIAASLAPHLHEPKALHLHDGFREDQLMVIMCVTRPYLEAQGYLLCPEYDGYWSDTEFSFRAYQDALVLDGRHVRFFHNHPAFTGAKSDAEYQRQSNPEANARGEAIFRRRNPLSTW